MKYLLFISLFLQLYSLTAQELKCTVQVSAKSIEGTDKSVFEKLQTELNTFVNEQKWTNYDFKLNERIDCSILINVKEVVTQNEFSGEISVVASRPVYNSSYSTPVFNYLDRDFTFTYSEFEPLEFDETSHRSNLTSVVVYYLYIILGIEFDSFTEMGGTVFFEKAEQIVSNASGDGSPGWKAFESTRNRYWLIENYMNGTYEDLRKFNYQYHLKGLDQMWNKQEDARSAVLLSFESLKKVKDARPGLFALQLMIDVKRQEIIDMFSEGSTSQRNQAKEIMKDLDPARSSDYNQMTQ